MGLKPPARLPCPSAPSTESSLAAVNSPAQGQKHVESAGEGAVHACMPMRMRAVRVRLAISTYLPLPRGARVLVLALAVALRVGVHRLPRVVECRLAREKRRTSEAARATTPRRAHTAVSAGRCSSVTCSCTTIASDSRHAPQVHRREQRPVGIVELVELLKIFL